MNILKAFRGWRISFLNAEKDRANIFLKSHKSIMQTSTDEKVIKVSGVKYFKKLQYLHHITGLIKRLEAKQ